VKFRALGEPIAIDDDTEVRAIGGEQSNQSLVVGDKAVLKIYRRLRSGIQPELEVSRFLSEVASFANAPALLGLVECVEPGGGTTALASVSAYVQNQGDCWHVIIGELERTLEDIALIPAEDEGAQDPWEERYTFPLDFAARLGQRTAELHRALAVDTADPAFAREPVTADDVTAWADATRRQAASAFAALASLPPNISQEVKSAVDLLFERRAELEGRIDELGAMTPAGDKIRVHGDYHLGQVMMAGGDAMIIDFEGEPGRPLEERRAKTSPMRDCAGMLRSFDYAAWVALDDASNHAPEPPAHVLAAAREWYRSAFADFLESYDAVARTSPAHPPDPATARAQLELFLLQKALYEICYEAASRPAWVTIPLRGVLDLLSERPLAP
jgi:maltose alpha-D-glucosyltransferase/alpha-amylase